jgi:hypothetical protein
MRAVSGEARMAWHAKDTHQVAVRHRRPRHAPRGLQPGRDAAPLAHPDQILAWRGAKVTKSLPRNKLRRFRAIRAGQGRRGLAINFAASPNGPTEAINNLIKRITRVGFGLRRLRHYR